MKRETMRLKAAGVTLALLAALLGAAPTVSAEEGEPAGSACDQYPVTIRAAGPGLLTVGTVGDDVIVGSLGDDAIDGRGGNDIICGHSGDDIILGGAGDDRIEGGNDNDDIQGGDGDDVIFGGNGDDILRGAAGDDIILGENGNDVLEGNAGDDTLWPGNGTDDVRDDQGDNSVGAGTDDGAANDPAPADPPADDPPADDPPAEEAPAGAPFDLTILHINDHHSHLESDSGDLELPGGETRVEIGGFPSVVAKIDELAAEASGEVVKIHAGDAITGTLFFSLFEGEADAALMNEACFDIFALGNHEFDNGDQGLADFLGHLNGSDSCTTSTLAANVVPAAGTPLAPDGDTIFDDNVVIDMRTAKRLATSVSTLLVRPRTLRARSTPPSSSMRSKPLRLRSTS